jgi:hypothetical protein
MLPRYSCYEAIPCGIRKTSCCVNSCEDSVTRHIDLKREIGGSIEILLGLNDFIRQVDGNREWRKIVVELVCRDDDNGAHTSFALFPALSVVTILTL